MALVQISDVVVPSVFGPYTQQITEQKARLVQSGVLARNPLLDQRLAGGGKTFDAPSWQDLADDDDNVATDTEADIITASFENGTPTDANRGDATPKKIGSADEISVRLVRNQSWAAANLSSILAGSDPIGSIGQRVGFYWARKLQKVFINTWNGVIADNTANDSGDYTNDVSGGAFVEGVTNFTAEAFLDTQLTLGDSMDDLAVMMVHTTVFNRMQKQNLIDFIPDARGETQIPTYQGLEVIKDDGMPVTGSVYDTWLFGTGAAQWGETPHPKAVRVHEKELAGNGDGEEVLTTRRIWAVHPVGHAFIQASIPNGGPSNTNLAAAANWNRVFSERKQIKFARLVTREA